MRAPQMIRIAGLVLTGLLAVSPQTSPGQDAGPEGKPPTQSRLPGDAADDTAGERAWRAHGFTAEQRKTLREPFAWGIEHLSHTAGFPGNDERRAARGESKTDGTLALLDLRQGLIIVAFTQVPTKQTQPFGDRLMQAINAVFPSR